MPKRTSERQIQANRRNALRSTGPRTAAGKAVSSKNALIHGVTAQQHLAEANDASQLAALRQAMIETHQPADPIETLLVERIVIATWKLRRVADAEATYGKLTELEAFRKLGDGTRDDLGLEPEKLIPRGKYDADIICPPVPRHVLTALMLRDPNNPLQRYQQYEQRLEGSIFRSLRQLRQLRRDREQAAEKKFGQNEPNSPGHSSSSESGRSIEPIPTRSADGSRG